MPPVLTSSNLAKAFGTHTLFTGVAINLEDRERLALIGPNGSGKSTLLKILAGLDSPDEGTVTIRKGARAAYVAQADTFPEGSTIISALNDSLRADMNAGKLPHIHDEHEVEMAAELALGRFDFPDPNQPTISLSGGQRKRLSIARALAGEPDIILFDEPTNHLDVEGIEWLEDLLRGSQGGEQYASIVVTHDRAFLESTAARIIELSTAYPDGTFAVRGNYTDFLRRKQDFLDSQAKQEKSLANQVRDDLRWLSRGAKARRTKSKARIDSSYERIDELADLRARNTPLQAAAIDFSSTDRKTRKLLFARAISKAYGEGGNRRLFTDLDILLGPGDKLALMGPNGSGKSTLIKVLTGEIEPDPPTPEAIAAALEAKLPPSAPKPGTIGRADKLKVVLFSQHRTDLDPTLTLRETLSPQSDSVIFQDRVIHVITWARKFLFTNDQLRATIGSLSGGEQARVHIAMLMLEPADVLILDEPTNDLDIPTLEVLEDSLEEFPGAVILVTHDRAMIADIATKVLALDGKGNAKYFADFDQWEKFQRQPASKFEPPPPPPAPVAPPPAPTKSPATKPAAASTAPTATKPRKKLSYNEQRELDGMEATIHKAEAEVKSLEAAMADPATAADRKRMDEVCRKLGEAQTRTAGLYERWTELGARQ